jgi:hypothetical protein
MIIQFFPDIWQERSVPAQRIPSPQEPTLQSEDDSHKNLEVLNLHELQEIFRRALILFQT